MGMNGPPGGKRGSWWREGAWVLAVIMFVFLLGWYAPKLRSTSDPPAPNHQYKVEVGNWLQSSSTFCHHYERDGDHWVLYDEAGNVIGEFTRAEGMSVATSRIN